MANFKIPNLCGASPDLNGALDEINKLKDKLTANIDVDASALKADLETGLGDLQSAFNKLEIKLPEVPDVNFQAEDGIRDLVRSRGLGDVYKRQEYVLSMKY